MLGADLGPDRLSASEVAAREGVSIGAVQHRFPAKDAMPEAAFTELVDRVRRRIAAITFGPDISTHVRTVLSLPLDAERTAAALVP